VWLYSFRKRLKTLYHLSQSVRRVHLRRNDRFNCVTVEGFRIGAARFYQAVCERVEVMRLRVLPGEGADITAL